MAIMFILLSLLGEVISQTCYSYSCSSTVTTGTCSTLPKNSNTITESPCRLGSYCNTIIYNGTCSQNPSNTRLPGEYCSSNSDCLSSRCYSSGTCFGALNGIACTRTQDCNPGLYCSNSFCTYQLKLGSSCQSSSECANSLVCDNGVCTTPFSLAIGQTTTLVTSPNFYPACVTGYANVTNTTFTCDKAPVSANLGANCTVPLKCMSSDNSTYKFCQCGLDGNGYCPPFEGDSVVTNLISSWKYLIQVTGNNNCSAAAPFTYACYVGFNNLTLLNAFLNYSQYAELYFNDVFTALKGSTACQQTVNTPDYVHTMLQINGTAPQCPVYYTQNPTAAVNGTCVYFNKNIFNSWLSTEVTVSACAAGQYCNSVVGQSTNCVDVQTSLNLPGQNCSTNSDCMSNNCLKKICQGVGVNGNCSSTKDCAPDLYCWDMNSTCQPAAVNGQNCDNTPCQSNLLCDESICTMYYSRGQGANTTTVTNGYAPACASGYATKNANGTYQCEFPPQSKTLGAQCNPSGTCSSSDNTLTKPCTCGFDGNGYCMPFEGDSYLQNAISYYKKIQSVRCNLMLSMTSGCYQDNLNNLLNYYYYYTNFNMYQSLPYIASSKVVNDNLINSTYISGYNQAVAKINYIKKKLSDESSSSSSFGELAKLTMLLGLVYLA